MGSNTCELDEAVSTITSVIYSVFWLIGLNIVSIKSFNDVKQKHQNLSNQLETIPTGTLSFIYTHLCVRKK